MSYPLNLGRMDKEHYQLILSFSQIVLPLLSLCLKVCCESRMNHAVMYEQNHRSKSTAYTSLIPTNQPTNSIYSHLSSPHPFHSSPLSCICISLSLFFLFLFIFLCLCLLYIVIPPRFFRL